MVAANMCYLVGFFYSVDIHQFEDCQVDGVLALQVSPHQVVQKDVLVGDRASAVDSERGGWWGWRCSGVGWEK